MAQSGFTPIQLYYSTTSGNTPSAGNLINGELAINLPDGRLFYDYAGVKVLGWSAPITQTGSFTVTPDQDWFIINSTGASVVTLPSAASFVGRQLRFLTYSAFAVTSSASNVVSTTGTVGTAILSAVAGKWATLVSDGTNWVIMQSN